MSITTPTIATICPSWCSTHTTWDGVTLHERHIDGDRWDIIITHDSDEGTTIDVGLPGDGGLSPSLALALGVALIEAAATVGQAEAHKDASTDASMATVDEPIVKGVES